MISTTNEELRRITGGCNWKRLVTLLRYFIRFI